MDVRARLIGVSWVAMCGAVLLGCGSVPSKSDAGSGGGDDAPGNGICEALKALRCEGTQLVSCNGEGTAEIQTECQLRCNATTLACEDKVEPSNDYAVQLDGAVGEPALNITQNTTIDTGDFNATTGKVTVGTQQVKAALVPGVNGAPDVLVISVGSLNVAAGAALYIGYPENPGGQPTVQRPHAFMSAGDVSIAGTIFVYPDGVTATDTCVGGTTSAVGADNDYPGGGGGGFGQPGAQGGQVFLIGNGGNGGPVAGTATLMPLRGGCRGGSAASFATVPGNGGGAIQITSATRIDVVGKIGTPAFGGNVSGGGGAGGGILLEAPIVSVTGGLYANGGAGGCGNYFSDYDNSGKLEMSAATRECGLSGGNGGFGTTPPTAGQTKSNTSGSSDYGAGGGGAVGRIRINTLDMAIMGTGEQSPPASLGAIATH